MLDKLYLELSEDCAFEKDKQANAAREKFCDKYVYPAEDSEKCFDMFCDFSDEERRAAFRVGFSCALRLIAEVTGIIDEI